MNKRGLEHVEAILSFVLFVGFLVFALYFFNPLDTTKVVDSSLYYAFEEIAQNATVSFEKYSIALNLPLPDVVRLSVLTTSVPQGNSYVKNEHGEVLDSAFTPPNRIDVEINNSDFVYLSLSEDINPSENPGQGVLLYPGNYTVASSEVKEVISEKKLLELKNYYDSNYQDLKNNFNLPGRIEFDFSVVFSNGEDIKSTKEIPVGIEVFSKTERIEVLRDNGEIGFAQLIVRVW